MVQQDRFEDENGKERREEVVLEGVWSHRALFVVLDVEDLFATHGTNPFRVCTT